MSEHKYSVCILAFNSNNHLLVGHTRRITECSKLVIPSGEVMYGEPMIAAARTMRDDVGVQIDHFKFIETLVDAEGTLYVYMCRIDPAQEGRTCPGAETYVDKWEWRNIEHISRRQGICGQRLSSLLAAIKLLLREVRHG